MIMAWRHRQDEAPVSSPRARQARHVDRTTFLLSEFCLRSTQFGVFIARYAISSVDPLRAVISYITGHRLLSVYFIRASEIATGMAAIISVRGFRLFLKGEWILAMSFLTAIILTWGEVHRTYANFGLRASFKVKRFL